MNQNWDLLVNFINKNYYEFPFELKPEMTLEEDLKISGNDAYELIDAFVKEFNINTDDFIFSDYFDGEGVDWSNLMFWKRRKERKKLSLIKLYQAIQTKKLS